MSKRDQLGTSSSFARASQARSVRRQLTDAAFGGDPTVLDLAVISSNPDNPREVLGDVSGMASSLLEIGQIQAITVASVAAYLRDRPHRASELEPGAEFVVVDGHRRLAGARDAGLTSIKVTVDDARVSTDEVLLESAFVANAQRENLSDLEEAHALKTLVGFYGSQHKAAKRLGVTQPYISQRLSLLELEPGLQADLEAGVRKVEHVRGLGKLPPSEQRAAADARARQAEEKRRSRGTRVSATPPSSTDNAVITEALGDRRGTEQAHSDTAATTSRSHDGPDPTQATLDTGTADESATAELATDARAHMLPAPAASGIPWHSPQALNQLARQHMSTENRQTLAKLLAEH
ncbi:ParB/RepB/Spo0J family partition protein [Streptomyces sp. NPDC001774]